jgi:hypothetical protein
MTVWACGARHSACRMRWGPERFSQDAAYGGRMAVVAWRRGAESATLGAHRGGDLGVKERC